MNDALDAVTSICGITTNHPCVDDLYVTRTGFADGVPSAGSPLTVVAIASVAAASPLTRNAVSGDQPSGKSAGKPCGESRVSDTSAGPGSDPAEIVTAIDGAVSVPPSGPIVVEGASVVSRASTTAVPTPF